MAGEPDVAKQTDDKAEIEFGAGTSARRVVEDVDMTRLGPIANGDLGSGRFAGDDVDPFAEDSVVAKHEDSDGFGLEAKLDEFVNEGTAESVDHDDGVIDGEG